MRWDSLASSSGQRSIRALVWFHRWTSIAVCLLFAMWFASGALMLFVPFPSLPASERLAQGEAIDFARIHVSPATALAAAPQATTLKLVSNAGTPVYIAGADGKLAAVIDADSGRARSSLDASAAQLIAERFSGAHAARVEADIRYDQWVVHQGFDAGRPYYRVTLDDAAHTVLYVSARSGEVAQRTSRSQRALNMGGAVLHWIYFTPIRADWSFWDRLVWWVSLLALLGASAGMIVGVYRFVQARRLNGKGFGLFRGWMRWHHILGIFAGVFLLGWIFSGWLSMDHGRLFSRGGAADAELERFRGKRLTEIVTDISLQDIQALAGSDIRELRFNALAAQSFVSAQGGAEGARIRFAHASSTETRLPDSLLLTAAAAAWPDAKASIKTDATQIDFYARAEETPTDARALLLEGTQQKLVYVDIHSGDVSALLDPSRRAYAWTYYALHTYKFPGLADHDTLRIGLMLLALAAGFSLSVTGMVLAYRHLFRR